jgi:MFS family permease
MIPLAIGAVLAVAIPARPLPPHEADDEAAFEGVGNFSIAMSLGGTILFVAFISGVGETAMQSLLPLYGIAHGLSDAGASRLVATFALGEAVLVIGLGLLADRYGRRAVLIGATLLAIVSTATLPFAMGHELLLQPALFLAGGTIAGVYTLGIVLIGQDFRGQRLAIVSTGFGMSYSAGSVLGATPIGYLIDLFGVEALPATVAAGFVALLAFLAWPGRKEAAGSPAD